MLEDAKVTISIKDLDELRSSQKKIENLENSISKCFSFQTEDLPEPDECKICTCDVCDSCLIFHSLCNDKIIVDVSELIKATRRLAYESSKLCTYFDFNHAKVVYENL